MSQSIYIDEFAGVGRLNRNDLSIFWQPPCVSAARERNRRAALERAVHDSERLNAFIERLEQASELHDFVMTAPRELVDAVLNFVRESTRSTRP